MLYKKVFKLPDIEYSVETMLHSDINHEPSSHEYANGDEYATHIVFEDGRKFQLDRPGKRTDNHVFWEFFFLKSIVSTKRDILLK